MKFISHISPAILAPIQGGAIAASDVQELKAILMRKLAWIVLVAYTLLILKPLLPVVADAFAHTFWKSRHMLVVHEVNGKFHLHNEIAQGAKQTEKEKQTVGSKYEMQDCVQVSAPAPYYSAISYPELTIKYNIYQCCCAHGYSRINYPPPKFLLTNNRSNMS